MDDLCPRLRDVHPDLRDLVRQHCLRCQDLDPATCLVHRLEAEVGTSEVREPYLQASPWKRV